MAPPPEDELEELLLELDEDELLELEDEPDAPLDELELLLEEELLELDDELLELDPPPAHNPWLVQDASLPGTLLVYQLAW